MAIGVRSLWALGAAAAMLLAGGAMAQTGRMPASAAPGAVATSPLSKEAPAIVTGPATGANAQVPTGTGGSDLATSPGGTTGRVTAIKGAPGPAPAAVGTAPAATPAATAGTPRFYAPTPGIGQPIPGAIGLQRQVTALGQQAADMNNYILLPIIIAICVLVLALLLWIVVRYRRSANPVPTRTSHNTLIEVIWTAAPVLVLLVIAVPSFKLLAAQYSEPKPDLTVKVIGHQWYWSYQYPDNGNFEVVSNVQTDAQDAARGEPKQLGVDERMVVPAGATVKLIVTSDDVIHSFAVPAFWLKMDAVPGRLNETWFKVDRPGVYYGECSELCGARHGFMPIAVEVVTPAQYRQWIAAKGGTIGGKPTSPDATANSPLLHPQVSNPHAADVGPAHLESATAVGQPVSQTAVKN